MSQGKVHWSKDYGETATGVRCMEVTVFTLKGLSPLWVNMCLWSQLWLVDGVLYTLHPFHIHTKTWGTTRNQDKGRWRHISRHDKEETSRDKGNSARPISCQEELELVRKKGNEKNLFLQIVSVKLSDFEDSAGERALYVFWDVLVFSMEKQNVNMWLSHQKFSLSSLQMCYICSFQRESFGKKKFQLLQSKSSL